MKKFFATVAVILALSTTANAADAIAGVDGFQGGCEVRTVWGGYGIISVNDLGAAYICSAAEVALAGRPNGISASVYVASQTGWGYGTYGGNTITNVYTYY
jgi:hypothetical protein